MESTWVIRHNACGKGKGGRELRLHIQQSKDGSRVGEKTQGLKEKRGIVNLLH